MHDDQVGLNALTPESEALSQKIFVGLHGGEDGGPNWLGTLHEREAGEMHESPTFESN